MTTLTVNAVQNEEVLRQPIVTQETGSAMIARAEALAPLLREGAEAADRNRAVSAESFQAMSDAGLFKMFKPKRYGGFELSPYDHVMVTLALARACASSAWIFSLYNTNNIMVMRYPEETQEEVWGVDPEAVLAGAAQVNAKSLATRVPGGFRLSGRWGFVSGSDFSDWLVFHAAVEGEPMSQLFLVPKSDTRTVDDWFPTGMRGTGSRTMEVSDIFVPDRRAIPPTQLMAGQYDALHPSFDLLATPAPFTGIYLLSAVPVGVAQGAVDYFIENGSSLSRSATVIGGDAKLADQEYVATQFSEAAGDVDLIVSRLIETSKRASERVKLRQPPSEFDLAVDARDNAVVTRFAAKAASTIHSLVGAKACFEGHPLSRAKRDTEMASTHVGMNWRNASVQYLAAALASR